MWLGPLAILVAWVTACLIYVKHDRAGHTTLSGVVASTRRAYWTFLVGMVASGIFFFLFIQQWLMDSLNLPAATLWIVGLAVLVLQPIVAIVPMNGKAKSKIHDVAAHAEGVLLLPIAFIIAQSRQLPSGVRIICWALLLFMIYLVREFKRNLLKPKFIHVQAIYTASFHLIILITTLSVSLNN